MPALSGTTYGGSRSIHYASGRTTHPRRRQRRREAAAARRRIYREQVPQPSTPAANPVSRFLRRTAPTAVGTGVLAPSAESALIAAALHGTGVPKSIERDFSRRERNLARQARHGYVRSHENLIEPDDLTNLILALSGAGELASLARTGATLGGRELAGEVAGSAARQVEASAVSAGARAAIRRELARRVLRTRAGREVAQAARTAGKRVARSAPGQAAARAAEKPALRAAGKVAAAPVRHPKATLIGGPVALQVPAVVHSGDLGGFRKALSGTGVAASVLSEAGRYASQIAPGTVGKNIVRDAFNLPAQALPSVYLPVAGAVEAAKGDDSRLRGLLDQYARTGLLPAIFRGDPQAALRSIEAHPLYAALEASGAVAVVGRGSGALLRGATRGRVASTRRAPLRVYGDIAVERRYSPDLIRQGVQRAAERRQRRRGGDPNQASARQAKRALRERVDRDVYSSEQRRRRHRDQALRKIEAAKPKGASAKIVSLVVQRILRHPETFDSDLRHYRAGLEKAARSGELSGSELRANHQLLASVDAALREDRNPADVVAAANAFIEAHGELVSGLVERGLLDAEQARKAAAIPFARVHMGAGYGLSRADRARLAQIREALAGVRAEKRSAEQRALAAEESRLRSKRQTLDRHGDPLSLDAIDAEMARHGVKPAGFLTHRREARGPGSFYRSFERRQTLPKGKRTGESVAAGTFDASFEALSEQLARSTSILDAVRSFDRFTARFALRHPEGRAFASWQEALHAATDPADFAMRLPEGIEFVPWRTAPLHAAKGEIAAALEHADPAGAEAILSPDGQTVSTVLGHAIAQAKTPGGGPVVLIPKLVAERLSQHFARLLTPEKAAQSLTGAFKSTVLPTSTKWLLGNAFESGMRTILAGIGPFDIRLGHRIEREMVKRLGPEEAARAIEQIVPGGHYSSARQQAVYRDARQFADTQVEGMARALGTLRRTPGPKQAINAYLRYRDAVFAFNTRFIERLPQYGALGKEARRQVQATTGRWHHALALGDGAVKDLVNGLRGTDRQVAYAKAVEEVYGNWGKNGPAARRFLTNLAPFWMWARAATRFVALTMPAHHPIKTGLLAAAEDMTEEERKRLGLSFFAAGALPPNLQGSIPLAGGGILPVQSFSSFGVFADYPSFLSNVVLPQAEGLRTLSGLAWTGERLTDAAGNPVTDPATRAALAAYVQAEAFLPLLAIGRRLREGGATAADTSTIASPQVKSSSYSQRGGIGSALGRVFNPFRAYDPGLVAYLRSLSGGGSGGGGGAVAPWMEGGSASAGIAPWKSGGIDYERVFSGGRSSSSGIDYEKVFSGGR